MLHKAVRAICPKLGKNRLSLPVHVQFSTPIFGRQRRLRVIILFSVFFGKIIVQVFFIAIASLKTGEDETRNRTEKGATRIIGL